MLSVKATHARLTDNKLYELPSFLFQSLLPDPVSKLTIEQQQQQNKKLAKKLLPFQQEHINLDISPLALKQLIFWTSFTSRFSDLPRQIVNFKNTFLNRSITSNELLQLAFVSDLFGQKTLSDLCMQELAKIVQNKSVAELRDVFGVVDERVKGEVFSRIQDIYIDEVFNEEQSD
ncbi:SKP1_component [Hexamita inflata]|uniref:Dimerisation n=1 Tax=Hexamita inflata TaxID=28002 RepID=A0AA86UFK3_9EUKA|nr:SKP1 component [Hexamita inflata]